MTVPSHPWASVIVPIKDERDNLVPLIEGLLTVMNSHAASQTRPFEIILVDDGSSDGSGEELDRLASQHPEVTTLHFDQNYGKTCALDAGFRQSSGELIIGIDGDLQQDSEDILKLLPYAATYDLVCGWRQQRQDGLVKKMSSRIANLVRDFFTHDGARHRMPAQDIPTALAGATAPLRRHAPILSRARAHAWVHCHGGAGPALPAHSRRLQVRHGQPIIQISL